MISNQPVDAPLQHGALDACDQTGNQLRLNQPIPDCRKVSGATPVQSKTREGTLHVRHASQRIAQVFAQAWLVEQGLDGLLPQRDFMKVARGGRKSPLQQACAAGSDRPVNCVEQRAGATAG